MPRTGRPLKLGSLVTIPAHGQPGTPDHQPEHRITVAERIYNLMETTGTRAELCARDVGVDRKTIESWMAAGARAEDKRNKNHLLTLKEQHQLDFLLNTRAAHARWTHMMLAGLSGLAAGGMVVGKIIEEVDPTRFQLDPRSGQPILDEQGNPKPLVLKRRIEQARQLPSESALRFLLERLARDDDGNRIMAQRVEVTGADGAPVTAGESRAEREERLAAELLAYAQGVEDQRVRQELDRPRSRPS